MRSKTTWMRGSYAILEIVRLTNCVPFFGKAIIPQIIAQNFFGIFVSLFCGEWEPLTSFVVVDWFGVINVSGPIHSVDAALVCCFFIPINCSLNIFDDINTLIIFIGEQLFSIDVVLFRSFFQPSFATNIRISTANKASMVLIVFFDCPSKPPISGGADGRL